MIFCLPPITSAASASHAGITPIICIALITALGNTDSDIRVYPNNAQPKCGNLAGTKLFCAGSEAFSTCGASVSAVSGLSSLDLDAIDTAFVFDAGDTIGICPSVCRPLSTASRVAAWRFLSSSASSSILTLSSSCSRSAKEGALAISGVRMSGEGENELVEFVRWPTNDGLEFEECVVDIFLLEAFLERLPLLALVDRKSVV